MENFDNVISYFSSFLDASELLLNESLKLHTSFKIGGNAKIFVQPKTRKHLKKVFKFILKNSIKFFILGAGTNTLACDEDFLGVVINLTYFKKLKAIKNKVYSECGVSLFRLNEFCAQNSLSGLEKTYGIPGSVGGGVIQNCGAYGYGISKNLVWVEIFDGKHFKKIKKQKLDFAYRNSSFKANKKIIVVSCLFKLIKKDKIFIEKTLDEIISKRRQNQPYEMPSAGSVFKRIDNVIVSKLLDELGLKGKTVGGAQVSLKHAGFIVNFDNATCKDVLELIDLIKQKVKIETGLTLEEEIVIMQN